MKDGRKANRTLYEGRYEGEEMGQMKDGRKAERTLYEGRQEKEEVAR